MDILHFLHLMIVIVIILNIMICRSPKQEQLDSTIKEATMRTTYKFLQHRFSYSYYSHSCLRCCLYIPPPPRRLPVLLDLDFWARMERIVFLFLFVQSCFPP